MPSVPGLDLLGLGHKKFPIADVLRLFPEGLALGAFDKTFGDATIRHLRILLDSGRIPAVRIHIWWSDQHKIAPLQVLKNRLPVYHRLSLEYPKVKFYLSHSCEHYEHDKEQVRKRINLIKKLCPNCTPVDCPGPGITPLAGVVGEIHSVSKGLKTPYIASQDGCGLDAQGAWRVDNKAWKKLHAKATIRFYWVPDVCNLRAGAGRAPPPKQRKPHKNWLNDFELLLCNVV